MCIIFSLVVNNCISPYSTSSMCFCPPFWRHRSTFLHFIFSVFLITFKILSSSIECVASCSAMYQLGKKSNFVYGSSAMYCACSFNSFFDYSFSCSSISTVEPPWTPIQLWPSRKLVFFQRRRTGPCFMRDYRYAVFIHRIAQTYVLSLVHLFLHMFVYSRSRKFILDIPVFYFQNY